jgi:hypothetical protein
VNGACVRERVSAHGIIVIIIVIVIVIIVVVINQYAINTQR